MYGARLLVESPAVAAALPHWVQIGVPFLKTAITYLLVPVASLAWLELSAGKMRLFLHAVILSQSGHWCRRNRIFRPNWV